MSIVTLPFSNNDCVNGPLRGAASHCGWRYVYPRGAGSLGIPSMASTRSSNSTDASHSYTFNAMPPTPPPPPAPMSPAPYKVTTGNKVTNWLQSLPKALPSPELSYPAYKYAISAPYPIYDSPRQAYPGMTYPLEDTVCHSYSTCPIFTAACPQLDEFLGNAAEQYGRIQLGLTGCSFGYDEMEKKINHEYYAPETKVVPQAQQSPEVDSFDILDSFSRSGSFVFEPFGLPDIDEDELTDFDVTLVPPSPFVNDATNTLPSSLRDDNDSVVPEDSIYFFGSFSPVIEKPKPVSNVIEEFYPQRTKVSSGPKSPMTWEEFEEMALKGIEGY